MIVNELENTVVKKYMNLLLLADPEKQAIEQYINQCQVYLLSDQHQSQTLAIAAVEKLSDAEIELKNIAVHPLYRRKGQGTYLMTWLFNKYRNMTMYVGTSDTESTLNFYYRLGFEDYDIRKNFFISQYAHPIYDNGKLLKDMKMLKKDLKNMS